MSSFVHLPLPRQLWVRARMTRLGDANGPSYRVMIRPRIF
jgi:hypothetical protein